MARPALPGPVALTRSVSGLERLWVTATEVAPPFVNQLVLEAPPADGALDWDGAMAAVAESTPGVGLTLGGALGWAKWRDRRPPAVLKVDGSRWTGLDGGGAPFLATPLDLRAGPTVELLVCEGAPRRVILRTSHATMDGRGTLLVAARLFAALRGEPLAPLPPSDVTDEQIAADLPGAPEEPPSLDCPPVLGEVRPAPLSTRWVRRDLAGPPAPRLLARTAAFLASRVPAEARDRVRVDVPVDLRRHRPQLQSTANLTGLVRLPVGRLAAGPDPVDAVAGALRSALSSTDELRFVRSARGVRWLPLKLMAWGGRRSARQALATARFSTSATVSNLGRLDLAALSAPGFVPERAFFIPPGSPGLPLFLTLSGSDGGVTLCAAAPLGLADGGRLEHLMDALAAHLQAPSRSRTA